MGILEIRKKYKINQKTAASILEVPVRTYRRYELDDTYGDNLKRSKMIESLNDYFEINETKGVLSLDNIKNAVNQVISEDYRDKISFCILFGSYAKGKATAKSDVDLYIDSSLTGFALTGLMEKLRTALHKNVDVIRPSEINNNVELSNEIMKWGVKIYG